MLWKRPTFVAYPSVWSRFSVKTSDNVQNFRIQDATADMTESIVNHMVEHYLKHEPLSQCLGTVDDEQSLSDFKVFWEQKINARTVLVCFEEDLDPRNVGTLVACNMTTVESLAYEDNRLFMLKGKAASTFLHIFSHILRQSKIFEKFSVDTYLNAYGLSVHEKYRGLGIGVELLKARTAFCKAMDIPLTVTVFTSRAGQNVAAKAGFRCLLEKKYSDLEKDIPGIELQGISHPKAVLMFKKIVAESLPIL